MRKKKRKSIEKEIIQEAIKKNEVIPMSELPCFDKDAHRLQKLSTLKGQIIDHILQYARVVENNHELNALLRAILIIIRSSPHYMRGPSNSILLRTIIHDTKFNQFDLPNGQIHKKITSDIMDKIRVRFLEVVSDIIIEEITVVKKNGKPIKKEKA